jgi:adenosylhomocysteine nucleosidase
MNIVVAAALTQELKPLLNHVKPQERLQTDAFAVIRATYLNHELVVVVTGIGIRNAEVRVESVLDVFHPDLILSIGFAGALYDGAAVGDLILATSVSLVSQNSLKVTAPLLGQGRLLKGQQDSPGVRTGSFFTLETPMEKKAIRALVPAEALYPVCEMETFPIAELARKRGIEFFAVRSITDRADEEIPSDFFTIASGSGTRQRIKAAALFLRKPHLIPMAAKLAVRSRKASKNLWLFFDALARAL